MVLDAVDRWTWLNVRWNIFLMLGRHSGWAQFMLVSDAQKTLQDRSWRFSISCMVLGSLLFGWIE
jgi:hypothetical protein